MNKLLSFLSLFFSMFIYNTGFAQSGSTPVDCSKLLTPAMVEEHCGLSGIAERVTSVERSGVNCNRVYRVGKGWGDELIFILTSKTDSKGAASTLDWMKKEYAGMGLKALNDIGDEAFMLDFTDKLTGRKNLQLVFRKGGMVIELKTEESRSTKTPCPCFDAAQLTRLAKAIASNIQ
jgi:hypothetical protein